MSASELGLPPGIRACLFDLDGVLTDTASVHLTAWRQVFAALDLEFSDDDYRLYVDGRRRSDGARTFLESHCLAASDTVITEIAARKDALFLRAIERDGVTRYDRSIAYVRAVAAAGYRRAVVSASRHCAEVLEAAGLAGLFELRVDGVTAADEDLEGKPAPDTFLYAARLLGVEPEACAVFEDALAGVEAGRAGGFGYVVGVARSVDPAELLAHGADVAVGDLAELCRIRASY